MRRHEEIYMDCPHCGKAFDTMDEANILGFMYLQCPHCGKESTVEGPDGKILDHLLIPDIGFQEAIDQCFKEEEKKIDWLKANSGKTMLYPELGMKIEIDEKGRPIFSTIDEEGQK